MSEAENQNSYDIPPEDSQKNSLASLVPTWFKVVSWIALVWNLLGLMAFVMQQLMLASAEAMSALPEAHQAIYKAMPTWVTIAFAAAVIAGTLGCVGLVMRKKWALPVLVVSLLGVLGQQAYMFFMSNTFEVMGTGAMAMPILVLVIAIALICLAQRGTAKGWLR